MNILVTGGAGFIGSHLVDKLISQRHKVYVVDDLSTGKKAYINKNASFLKTKIQNANLFKLFKTKKFDIVFHLAAQKNLQFSKEYPVKDADINIIGSLNILSCALQSGVKKIIFYSTAAVYDPGAKPPNKESDCPMPISPYGIAKFTFENYLKNSGINYSILRLSNVYGPRQDSSGEGGAVSIFCENLLKNKKSIINNSGKQTRDFINVHDVIEASVKCITKAHKKILNISTNKEVSINSLYQNLNKLSRKDILPLRNIKLKEQYRSSLSNRLAKKELKWKPKIDISKGLKKTYNWFEK